MSENKTEENTESFVVVVAAVAVAASRRMLLFSATCTYGSVVYVRSAKLRKILIN